MRETGARRRGSCITSRGGRSIVCNRFGYRCGNCNWTVLFQFANAYCIGGARSRSGVALIGFAVMLVSVVDEMHERAGQKQQVWQRGQGVTRMRPEQIASECREKEGNRKPEFRMKKAENGVHHGFSCNRSATVLLFWPFAGVCRQRTEDKDTNHSIPVFTREEHASSIGMRYDRLGAAAVMVRRRGFRRHCEGFARAGRLSGRVGNTRLGSALVHTCWSRRGASCAMLDTVMNGATRTTARMYLMVMIFLRRLIESA